MDRMRTRRPSMKTLPPDAPKPTYEDFKPEIKWSQDDSNHLLLIHLPGFKREEIKVQLEESGKIIVRGSRKVSESKFVSVDQSFDVPKDAIIGQITGNFQNGDLTLIMPIDKQKRDEKKKSEDDIKKKTEVPEKKDEPIQQDKPKAGEENKDEPSKRETVKNDDKQKRDEDAPPKKATVKNDDEQKRDEDAIQNQQENSKKEDESKPIQQEMRASGDEKKDEPTPKEMVKSDEKLDKEENKEEPEMPKKDEKIDKETTKEEPKTIPKEKHEQIDEETEEVSVQNEKPRSEEGVIKSVEEVIQKMSKRAEDGLKKVQGSKKRGPNWRNSEDGWLHYGLIDNLMEKMNRNRKVIAVAIVSFSVGFYVSRKLQTSGR